MQLQEGPVPLYHQLASDIRQQISCGRLLPGDALPSEDRLCEEYGVSRITVRRAIDDLIADKLVERRRGVGTFVASPVAARSVSLVGSLYDALNYPANISVELIQCALAEVPEPLASQLQLADDAQVYELDTISRIGDVPFAVSFFYLPRDIGEQIDLERIGLGSPIARLVELVIKEPVTRAEQIVQPVTASEQMAERLGIPVGTAILNVLRTYYSESGHAVEATSVFYRPDQHTLRVELVSKGN